MLRLQALAGNARARAPNALSASSLSRSCSRNAASIRASSTTSTTASLRKRPQAPGYTSRLKQLQGPNALGFFTRSVSTQPTQSRTSRTLKLIYGTAAWAGIFTTVGAGIVLAFFIYDSTTYNEEPFNEDISVSELALFPRIGGPKNLPIAEHLMDDDDSPEKKEQKHKPKLVVLGTGWGSIALLKGLNPDDYHVTVVAPSNYFLFTPMLPSATVGTLELRSLVEPVRRIISKLGGHFMKAKAVDVEFSDKLVEIQGIGPNGEEEHFYLPYDKLIIGVGE